MSDKKSYNNTGRDKDKRMSGEDVKKKSAKKANDCNCGRKKDKTQRNRRKK